MLDALVNLELDRALLTALAAAFVGGLARGFSGFGAGLIFMPLASAALGPRVAAPVLLIIDAVLILPYVRAAVAACERSSLLLMVAGAYAGIPLGVYLLASQVTRAEGALLPPTRRLVAAACTCCASNFLRWVPFPCAAAPLRPGVTRRWF